MKACSLEAKYKEIKSGSRLFHSTIISNISQFCVTTCIHLESIIISLISNVYSVINIGS